MLQGSILHSPGHFTVIKFWENGLKVLHYNLLCHTMLLYQTFIRLSHSSAGCQILVLFFFNIIYRGKNDGEKTETMSPSTACQEIMQRACILWSTVYFDVVIYQVSEFVFKASPAP